MNAHGKTAGIPRRARSQGVRFFFAIEVHHQRLWVEHGHSLVFAASGENLLEANGVHAPPLDADGNVYFLVGTNAEVGECMCGRVGGR